MSGKRKNGASSPKSERRTFFEKLCWRIVLVENKSLISGSFILHKKAAKMTTFNPYFLGTSTHKYVADEALLSPCKARHLGAGAPCCVCSKNFIVKIFYCDIFCATTPFALLSHSARETKGIGRGIRKQKRAAVGRHFLPHGSPLSFSDSTPVQFISIAHGLQSHFNDTPARFPPQSE